MDCHSHHCQPLMIALESPVDSAVLVVDVIPASTRFGMITTTAIASVQRARSVVLSFYDLIRTSISGVHTK